MKHNVKITLNGIPNIEATLDTDTDTIDIISGQELITTTEEQKLLNTIISSIVKLNI